MDGQIVMTQAPFQGSFGKQTSQNPTPVTKQNGYIEGKSDGIKTTEFHMFRNIYFAAPLDISYFEGSNIVTDKEILKASKFWLVSKARRTALAFRATMKGVNGQKHIDEKGVFLGQAQIIPLKYSMWRIDSKRNQRLL